MKKNQPALFKYIDFYYCDQRRQADYEDEVCLSHGRIEQRRIWVTTDLNNYVNSPHVAQVYRIEREVTIKKTGATTIETAYGITSRTVEQASPKTILHLVRGHCAVEVCHYIIDWIYDEDRPTIRTGHVPENMTRLRRFATGLLKSK